MSVDSPDGGRRRGPSWVGASPQTQGLARYLEVLRAGLWLVVLTFVLCVGGAVLYLSQAEKVYEAEADLLVSPLSRELTTPVPGLIQQSSDPTRDVETMARLLASPPVARRVKAKLNLDGTTKQILEDLEATPVAQSSIVAVVAEGPTPKAARDLANTFATEMVAHRTERMKKTLGPIIDSLQAEVDDAGAAATGEGADAPRAQLNFLKRLNAGNDPTVVLESPAELPSEATSPRPVLTLAAAIMGGLVLGLLGAFGLSLLDPRLRREEQLRQRFRLPVLARVPVEKSKRNKPLLPTQLSMGALDSYQALRAALSNSRQDNSLIGRTILVTGPSPGDGKTTSAINLASTLAAAGKRVILIEADSRRPSMGRALDMKPERGLASVITGKTYLVDALIPIGGEDSKLRVLLTSPDEAPAADVLSHLAVETLLLQAQKLADWVVIDSPPLNHVAETMTLAREVDDVLVVVRMGRSNMRDLNELAEMLVQAEIEPAGFVVLSGQARPGYY